MRRETVTGLRAAPHTAPLTRLASLRAIIGAGLAGRAGSTSGVRGVDRGDPTVSWTGPTEGRPTPTQAIGRVSAGASGQRLATPVVQDQALTNPTLDPYNSLLLARMKRPS